MRFFDVVLSGAALISAAMAVQFTSFPTSIEPGKTYTLEWTPADDTPTTIKLRQGDPNDLDTIATLTGTLTTRNCGKQKRAIAYTDATQQIPRPAVPMSGLLMPRSPTPMTTRSRSTRRAPTPTTAT